MAKKHKRPKDSAAQAADDLNVIFPDSTVVIAGENIVVSEYPFMTWLKIKAQCGDLVESFAELLSAGKEVVHDDVLEVFENNFHEIQFLLLEGIHKDQQFLSKLSDEDMQKLIFTWWQVNKHFFLRSAYRLLRTKTQTQSDGQASSRACSATGTTSQT